MNEIRFENPPLLCVIFSFQAKPIEKFSSRLPALISALKEAGLTEFDQAEMTSVNFSLGSPEDNQPRVLWQTVDQWDFRDEKKTALLRIDPESFLFRLHFTDYCHFAKKKNQLKDIFQALENALPEITLTEISLRYVNHMPLEDGENLLNWVHPSLLGLAGQPELNLTRVGSNTETIFDTSDTSRLIVRCTTAGGGFIVPPDLMPLDLKFHHSLQSQHGFIRLENTHVSKKAESFEHARTLTHFSSLRSSISDLFAALTTPTAHEKWQRLSS